MNDRAKEQKSISAQNWNWSSGPTVWTKPKSCSLLSVVIVPSEWDATSPFLCHSLQEHAFESSQKYKEGKFIIELAHMIKDNGWDWGASSWVTTTLEGREAGSRGGDCVRWVSVWLWFGWFTINLCNLLPIHTPLDVHTHVTCGNTHRGPRHPSLTGGPGDWPAIDKMLRFGFSFIKHKLWKAAPQNVPSAVLIILPCLKIAAARRPVGSIWQLALVLVEELITGSPTWMRPKMTIADSTDWGYAIWAWWGLTPNGPEHTGL